MPASRSRAVLLVGDESLVSHDVRRTLSRLGYDALAIASSADEALARAAERCPDVALVDVRIQGRVDGIGTAQLLQERFRVPVVYLTARSDDATFLRAKQTRPHGHVMKPVKPHELKSAIELAISRHDEEKAARAVATPPRETGTPRASPRDSRAPGARVVRRQIEQIFASTDFDASRRSREFLRFIVEETLAGRGDALSQASIATRVFGRKDDFDAVVDPIVRIQAGRLRRSLERYYLLSGIQDALRIELPRGSYVPAFHTHAEAEPPSPHPQPEPRMPVLPADDWPSVVIEPFAGAASDAMKETAAWIDEELVLELGRYRFVRPLLQRELDRLGPAHSAQMRFSLGGRLRQEAGELRVSARLVDRTTGEQLWGDEYQTVPSAGRWSGTVDDIARVIAARVSSEEGVIVQTLAGERRKDKAGPMTPYRAILLSYEFFLARDPESLVPAVSALRRVVEAEPDFGLAWTQLARLCQANYSLEVASIPTSIDDAITYAQHGMRVDPASRRARCVLASALLIKGELAAARAELDEALRLAPDSLVYLEIIGYLLSLLGENERGALLIRRARERNPHCLPHASFGMWCHHLRRGEFDLAYAEALEYRDPAFFWRALMRACCLAHLGRTAEARTEVADLLRRRPTFAARGRILVGHYIKLPEVLSLIVDGLAKAGLKLA